jgi:hypothetical protein
MATHHASLSHRYGTSPRAELRRAVRTSAPDGDAMRRTAMVVGGFVIALVSLAVGSFALVQVGVATADDDREKGCIRDVPHAYSQEPPRQSRRQ